MDKMGFLVPEYYKDFSCKCGDCRHSCCQGWGITVGMEEYYRLLGMTCEKHLRAKLDCALKIADHPTRARYAMLGPDWDGKCPLQAESGLCSLQTHMGAAALPCICRVYPRAYRQTYARECALSGSCERVIELLFALNGPMRFESADLAPEALEAPAARPNVTKEDYISVRKQCLDALQDRSASFAERLNALCEKLVKMDDHRQRDIAVYAGAWDDTGGADDASVFGFAAAVTCVLGASSRGLAPFFESALENLGLPKDGALPDAPAREKAGEAYARARARFEQRFSKGDERFEQMLVNHVFFTDFPYSDLRETFADESASLAATYLVLRFLCVAYMANREKESDLVDVAAACFRVIEHTAFDYNACLAVIKLENAHSVRLSEAVRRV